MKVEAQGMMEDAPGAVPELSDGAVDPNSSHLYQGDRTSSGSGQAGVVLLTHRRLALEEQ